MLKPERKNFDPLPNHEAQNFMKQLAFAVALLAPSSPLLAQTTCPGCTYSAPDVNPVGQNGVTLEIEAIDPIFVGGTQTGGCENGKCVITAGDCIEARRCKIKMEVTLGGTASPFKFDFCRRSKRIGTNPSPWDWDCDDSQSVNAGTVFREDRLSCGTVGEYRVQISVTSAPPASLPTNLEIVLTATCTICD